MNISVFINAIEVAFAPAILADYERITWPNSSEKLTTFLTELQHRNEIKKYVVLDADGDKWKQFKEKYTLIEAAGGLVINNLNELLVIKRLGVWDLPKGKMETKETPAICAKREVEEECGLQDLTLGKKLPDTFHTYIHKGKNVLKQTYWYEMHVAGAQNLTPQTEEDITEVLWMNAQRIREAKNQSYASLQPLFDAYLAGHE